MLVQPPPQQPGIMSTAPPPTPAIPQGAYNAQQGYNGAAGQAMSPLASALMKAKLQQKLAGMYPGTVKQLPGTTPQSLGAGTGMSDAASGTQPLNLGGMPNPAATANV